MKMPSRLMFVALLAVAAMSARAAETDTVKVAVPAQPIAAAINELSRQSGLHIVIDSRMAEGVTSTTVEGELTAEAALGKLLEGTGLSYEYLGENAVAVVKRDRPTASAADGKVLRVAQTEGSSAAEGSLGSGESAEEQRNAAASAETSDSLPLDEILVTAQKRIERLQDVPVPVTVLEASTLLESNQVQLQDYYTRVPGLNLTVGAYGGAIISVRGITSGVFNDGTTSIVVDDVPYGISSAVGPGEVVPELDPNELTRVEVLRGPQGTLYGASSMGGLLKYVTVDPSTDRLSGRLHGSINSIHNGDGAGYSVRGAINIPLAETFAVRASGFHRRDPGYIDDPVHGIEGVNWGEVMGGRLSALWRLSQNFSLKLGATYQDSDVRGNSYVNVVPGFAFEDLKQSTVPGSGGYRKKLQLYSANLTGSIGKTDLTAVSAYSVVKNAFLFDATPLLGQSSKSLQVENAYKFTQEVRLTVPLGETIDWLIGGFYDRENIPQFQSIVAADFTTGAPGAEIAFFGLPASFEEHAAFTNFTFHITDRFDLQVGGRGSQNEQALTQTNRGPLFGGGTIVRDELRSKDSSFTYLLTPQFRVSRGLMLYARLASGYRPGGPNLNAALGVGAEPEFDPDSTLNYEIGVKGSAFDNAFSFDASVYYIDWKDMLINLQSPVGSYKDNASRAKSQGLDLSIEARPLTGFTVSAWGAWNTAELTEDFPTGSTVRGVTGDRLPFSSRFSGGLSLDQEFNLTETLGGFAGISGSYVDDRIGGFVGATGQRQIFPSYTKVDVRAGVRADSWTASLFVNNVADKRGLINGGAGNLFPNSFVFIQPRTVGLSLSRSF